MVSVRRRGCASDRVSSTLKEPSKAAGAAKSVFCTFKFLSELELDFVAMVCWAAGATCDMIREVKSCAYAVGLGSKSLWCARGAEGTSLDGWLE